MARFRYKAVTASGETVEGVAEGESRAAVVEWLRGQGQIPIRADPADAGASLGRLLGGRGRDGLNPRDLGLITQGLATLLNAGIPLDRALDMLTGLMDRPQLAQMVANLREGVRSGKNLADAMAAQDGFPRYYLGLVRAGERGGALEQALEQLSEIVARRQALQQSIRSALQYPMIVLVAAAVSILILMLGVIPEFAPLFPADAALPLTTRAVLGASNLMLDHGWLLLGAVVLLVLGLRAAFQRAAFKRSWDRFVLRSPIFGELVMNLDVSRTSWTLGNLLRNGIEVVEALSMAAETAGNTVIREKIASVAGKLRKGEGLAGPLSETGMFPATATQLIAVGEKSGQLDAMLIRVGDIYETEARRHIDRLLGLMVPVITAVLGLFVAGIIGSIISAILSSYEMPL